MTNEALRAAKIAEATRRYASDKRSLLEHLMDIYETNWTPPEPVNPDLLAARKWLSDVMEGRGQIPGAADVRAGRDDDAEEIAAYLAGCTRGREGVKGLVEVLETVDRAMEIGGAGAVILRITTADRARIKDALASAKRGG